MKSSLILSLFIAAEIVSITYILLTANQLPLNIASHFDGVGTPNGFMSQTGYTVFMVAFTIGIPSALIIPALLVSRFSSAINIPNKRYWLSEANKTHTFDFLMSHCLYLGLMTMLFLTYLHWLILETHKSQPPILPNDLLYAGLGIYLTSMLAWSAWLIVKFSRTPK